MKIGQLVQFYIPKINAFCEQDIDEFANLRNISYCKKNFNINYSFYEKVDNLTQKKSVRFWVATHIVRKQKIRVTSQWGECHRPKFIQYLILKKIAKKADFSEGRLQELSNKTKKTVVKKALPSNPKYRANAIGGNVSNPFIRNILSSLSPKQFNEQDWIATKKDFENHCIYCKKQSKTLTKDHAIPINKDSLGEHRLGNIVPSCNECNKLKGDKHFETFLKGDDTKIDLIKAYMDSKNYEPLGNNEQVKAILSIAYDELKTVGDRYVKILNQSLSK